MHTCCEQGEKARARDLQKSEIKSERKQAHKLVLTMNERPSKRNCDAKSSEKGEASGWPACMRTSRLARDDRGGAVPVQLMGTGPTLSTQRPMASSHDNPQDLRVTTRTSNDHRPTIHTEESLRS